jgi:hypothetical protein
MCLPFAWGPRASLSMGYRGSPQNQGQDFSWHLITFILTTRLGGTKSRENLLSEY